MKHYKHIFFDLDRTLWDFDTNSKVALTALHHSHKLSSYGIASVDEFVIIYQEINERLWAAYRMGNIRKDQLRATRFAKALAHFGCDNSKLGGSLEAEYVSLSPHQTGLMPDALETLEYLAINYQMHIITNGFEEVQQIKMDRSGIAPFFKQVITSERAQARKPDPVVFNLAFHLAGTKASEALMIGDDLYADIRGARGVWMDQVYFNPLGKDHDDDVTYEIKKLAELRSIL